MKCRLSSILFRFFLLLYLAVVAFLCFADFNDMPDIQKTFLGVPTDKIVHFCMFFPMPVIGYMAYGGEKKTIGKILVAVLNSCVFCCIFAGWSLKDEKLKAELTNNGTINFPTYGLWKIMMKVIAPAAILCIFATGLKW